MKSQEKNHKNEKISFFKHNLDIVLLVLVVVIGAVFSFFQVFKSIDYRFFDMLLAAGKEIKNEDANIVLIDIEDQSINELGSWPWTRDILGNVLIRMKELGAYNAVFDIEYLSESSFGINDNIGEITENAFTNGESAIASSISEFARNIANRSIGLNGVRAASADLISNEVDIVLYDMFNQITNGLHKDNDLFFGQAAQFFGNASLTINTRDVSVDRSDEDREYAKERFLFGNVVDSERLINAENEKTVGTEKGLRRDFVPAVQKIMQHASTAGFTNVIVDGDGSRRRVELLNFYDGKFTGQLAFAPLMKMLDLQFMERKKNALVLHGVILPGSNERRSITVPLDMNGHMIINWAHRPYEDSFKHAPVYNFYFLDWEEKQIVNDLLALYSADGSSLDPHDAETFLYASDVLDIYYQSKAMLTSLLNKCKGFDIEGKPVGGGLTQDDYDMYFSMRNEFFDNAEALAEMCASFNGSTGVEEISNLQMSLSVYREDFAAMQEIFKDAFCIVGNSATGSTDLGTMPFQNRYPNMGTHANVVNTIIQADFITEYSPLWAIAGIFVLAFVNLLLSRKVSAAGKNIHGFVYLLVPPALIVMLFILFRIYIPITAPLFVVIVTYIAELALNYVKTNEDKNTLKKGFGAYVAPEVVDQIVKNPGLLGLGGMNKHMTALFSDVQKFSAFTEQINKAEGESHGAVRLVEILNGYLGVLSDAIMECRGTIDKYVGDEIVSFFGAPIDNPNNAFDSCLAGIRMKQAEDRYNEEHEAELPLHPVTGEPFLLKSRVGCNTGDMVVGNMGTEKKLNYTIMGNNVNLASRLEGTNKEYDSWIMASESTWLEANSGENEGKIVARQLDCVKVINVEKPVQIYSIVGLRSELTPEEIEAAEIFNQGMEWYLKGRETPAMPKDIADFKKAIEFFEKAYKCLEPRRQAIKDFISPEKKMAMRCQNYLKNGLPRGKDGKLLPWDGVFTMATK